MKYINICVAGNRFSFRLRYSDTKYYFDDFISYGKGPALIDFRKVDKQLIANEATRLGSDPAFAEYSLLIEKFANGILPYSLFLFHCAAFIWHGRAYIITAKSGVGKTTQLRHWQSIYPKEIEIINGDKPVIEVCHSNHLGDGRLQFMVHPSPWTGKEGWNGTKSAELAGIILLEQGDHDEIRRLNPREAVFPLFLQFLYIPDNAKNVELVCEYEKLLLNRIPVWKLINTGTKLSAELTHETLIKEGF